MEDFLNHGGRIDIGWGYWNDLKKVKLSKGLNTRRQIWNAVKNNSDSCWKYDALAPLTNQLEDKYRKQFKLKLLGTHEKYLVWWSSSNNSWAMLGSHNFLTSTSIIFNASYRKRELGLKTSNPKIINEMIKRFDEAKNLEE